MSPAEKQALLAEFGAYLDGIEDPRPTPDETTVDLFTLFAELAALRTEVKTQTRGFRSTLDELRTAQSLLHDQHGRQQQLLDRVQQELPVLRRQALRPLLLALLDLHDRLAAGQQALQGYQPVRGWFRRIKSRAEDRRFIDSIRDGQHMTLCRLEETLARYEVRAIPVLGEPVDPHTMTVVELDARPDLASGVVTAEVRRGFRWGDEVLRLAEVRANKYE